MQEVAIVSGRRSPFLRAGGNFSRISNLDLAISVINGLIDNSGVNPDFIQELYFGSVLNNPRIPNLAREVILRSNLPSTVQGHSVSNNCITSLVAIGLGAARIRTGKANLVLAGGSESMSLPPLTFSLAAQQAFIALSRSKNIYEKIRLILKLRPSHFLPEIPSPREPSTGLTMGEHCELTTQELKISRQQQDSWALESHRKASLAKQSGSFKEEIVAINGITEDDIPRSDTSLEKLGKLSTVFDKSDLGTLTAGNSSTLTDGAAALILANRAYAENCGLPIKAVIIDEEFNAIDPNIGLLMAPVEAVWRLLHRNSLALSQIDLLEIHEAFAAQVLGTLFVWEQGWSKMPQVPILGKILPEKINLRGGSLALGHPFAATGARITYSLASQLKRDQIGLISICAAGGMGGAMLLRGV
jgi:acetyl-CoA acetyltransferase family protein